jgi:cyclopropane fatty-acyl-phospholipid synthase-like methyltransferase
VTTAPDRLQRSVIAHYESQLREHGATARGMDWKDEASQRLRFRMLCDVCDLSGLSVHEVGAGAGHLLDYLVANGIDAGYSGSDLSAEMVEAARLLHPETPFHQRSALEAAGDSRYDVLLCSGLFHVKLDGGDAEWSDFVEAVIRHMYASCRVAIAFNLMSDAVDYRREALYHSSPAETVAFCTRELSRFVKLRHDYPLYEYTVYVYREPTIG